MRTTNPFAACWRRTLRLFHKILAPLRRPPQTLRVRLAVLLAGAVALLGGVNRLYLDTRILHELEHELEMRALSIGRHLRNESVDLILRQDLVGLQELLSDAQASGFDFAYAFVMDPTDQVMAHTFEAAFPEPLKLLNRYRARDGYQIRRIQIFGEHFRDFALPIYRGDLGVLRLGVRDKRILQRVASVRRELLLILLAVMVLSAAAAYTATYFALKPLAAITAALERFEPGKRRERITVRRHDEVGHLAAEVNLITARLHESYRQMMQTEKMVAAGLMASGIAHEINNPISGLQNCLRRIQAHPDDTEQTKEYAALMLQATDHIETVVRGLLDFSRSTPRQLHVIDLRQAVQKALHLSAFRLEKNRIELRQNLPDTPVRVRGDEAQLVQVVVNVVLNAVDAMPDGGILEAGLTSDGDQTVLRIQDNGNGIAPEHLSRVFEPFFTTKGGGKGTGLGLAVTHAIVTEHGGSIDVDSDLENGTEITIKLPLYRDDRESRHEAA